MANPGTRVDALPAFHFEVDIGGTSYPFRSCTGLSSETKVFEVEEGGVNGFVHKLVGTTTFPNLVFRQGFCNPAAPLYQLYQAMLADSGVKRRFDGFVRQIGPNGTSAKWVFKQGWIAKWQGPELDATKNEVSIESIEIVHEGLQLVGAGSSAAASATAGGLLSGITGGISGSILGSSVFGGASSAASSAAASAAASAAKAAAAKAAAPSSATTPSSTATPSSTTSSSTSSDPVLDPYDGVLDPYEV